MSSVTDIATLTPELAARAAALDAADPLAEHRDRFIEAPGVHAYLDGNSLGRPLASMGENIRRFVEETWGARLIRAWDEGWMDAPTELGDRVGAVVLGAAPGQTAVADSTTVLLYKLVRAAITARPGRDEIIVDTHNFPTDRFVLQGIAAECGMRLVWVEPDIAAGVTAAEVEPRLGPRTALVLLSHIAYRSGHIADVAAITRLAHSAGALMLWDLCHSAGAVPIGLDAHGVDLAVGCTYKYLNGGPGSPAFAYVNRELQETVRQPIQGWMGSADPFAMPHEYQPAPGIRQVISGTPPIVGMLAMREMLDLIEHVGIEEIRRKSVSLTEFAIELYDELLASRGVVLSSPRESSVRGSHITLDHPDFKAAMEVLWRAGIVPDFRPPSGIRIGLSPLSSSYGEIAIGLSAINRLL